MTDKKVGIHAGGVLPRKLWHWLKKVAADGLSGTIIITLTDGKVTRWHLNAGQKVDPSAPKEEVIVD